MSDGFLRFDNGTPVNITPTWVNVKTFDVSVNIPDASLRAALESSLGKAAGTPITAAELQKLTALQSLGNAIQDLTGLKFAINLIELNLSYNEISDISPLAGLTNLKRLTLWGNQISDISALAGLTNLSELDLSFNEISDISALAGLTNLKSLNLHGNPVPDLTPISQLENLTKSGTKTRQLMEKQPQPGESTQPYPWDLTFTFEAEVVALAREPILIEKSGSVNLDIALTTIRGNTVTVAGLIKPVIGEPTEAEVTVSVRLRLSNTFSNTPINIPDVRLHRALARELGKDREDPITVAEMQTLTSLRIGGIQDLTGLEFAINLTKLEFEERYDITGEIIKISDISPLSRLINLETLDLYGNKVSDISPLAKLTNLRVLGLRDNEISDIPPLSRLINLETLDLYGNKVTDISPLAGLENLKELDLNDNEVSNISSLVGFKNLTHLRLNNNKVSNLSPLAGLDLIGLDLQGNGISDISPIANLINITSLRLHSNEISDISPLAGLKNLIYLDLYSNEISDISPLTELKNLEKLTLGDNKISDISPLAGLTKLRLLTLHENRISDFAPVANLIKNMYHYTNSNQDVSDAAAPSVPDATPPVSTALLSNYPNPFNPETWIPYHLAEPADVTLTIYSADGKSVRTLALGHQPAGIYESKSRAAYWDGRNSMGERVASGVYFYTLTAGDFAATGKMLIMK